MPKKATPRTRVSRPKTTAPATSKKAVSNKKKPAPTKPSPKKSPTPTARRRKPRPAAVVVASPSQPLPRRAIFVDVENSSNETELMRVLDHLEIDRMKHRVELTGVGNWKALGTRFARTLGKVGAQLLHTAPPAGVRDWSDLWIAVSIGRWIAHAQPGDLLDVVSDDRAFDAIADAASAAGVTFRRLSYRSLTSKTRERESREHAAGDEEPRRPRRRRRRASAATTADTAAPEVNVSAEEDQPVAADDHHAATEEQIRATLRRIARETDGWINLDALANTLRAEGFLRPPGSLRLLTRLRRMGDVEVLPNGLLRLQP